MNFLGPLFTFLANLVGLGSKRSDLRNAADVKQAAKAQKAVSDDDAFEKALKDGDVDAVRKGLAE